MKDFSINLNKATDGHPVSIEVSAKYEKQIIEHIRKVVPVNDLQLNDCKEAYKEKEVEMVRFTLPDVSDDQLSKIAWFVGEWYSRMEPLVNRNLN